MRLRAAGVLSEHRVQPQAGRRYAMHALRALMQHKRVKLIVRSVHQVRSELVDAGVSRLFRWWSSLFTYCCCPYVWL
jgi:hypothetical protein